MLKQYINDAIGTLDGLIKTTEQDIENIKQAKHTAVDESVKTKNALIRKFEDTKRALDKELVRLSKIDGGQNLADVLDDEVKSKLVLMREKLETLNVKNREYARHVVLVKDFFDSLAKEIFKPQDGEYSSETNTYKTRV
ncbi:flagellar export chaperone FlgN [Campylobacter suis]|uniref:Flagellar biosynthesis protein FlgN n=1 Tax=Campylobacter suis TaxID=2790657 RepID=A0ABM8Q2I7_9BACT|nr:flagellar export chaperone FlgN [Campylobacter suis]CAD7287028.1 hypothetical protein LMG8286_00660 [Campylobacter suis]